IDDLPGKRRVRWRTSGRGGGVGAHDDLEGPVAALGERGVGGGEVLEPEAVRDQRGEADSAGRAELDRARDFTGRRADADDVDLVEPGARHGDAGVLERDADDGDAPALA